MQHMAVPLRAFQGTSKNRWKTASFMLLCFLVVINAVYFVFFTSADSVKIAGNIGRSLVSTAVLPDGSWVVTTEDNHVLLAKNGVVRKEAVIDGSINAIEVAANGSKLYIGTMDRKIHLLDAISLQEQGV